MQFHNIKVGQKNKKAKRIGRGGSHGTYAGRGGDGQKSRSGGRKKARRIQVGRKGYFKSVPHAGGFRSLNPKPFALNISKIIENKKVTAEKEINLDILKKHGLVSKKYKGVKVVGPKDKKSVKGTEVKGLKFSKDIQLSKTISSLL